MHKPEFPEDASQAASDTAPLSQPESDAGTQASHQAGGMSDAWPFDMGLTEPQIQDPYSTARLPGTDNIATDSHPPNQQHSLDTGGNTARITGKVMGSGPLSFLRDGQRITLNQREYQVLRRLGKQSGESQVYLLGQGDEQQVLKYYYPGFRPKMHVLEELMRVSHPGIVSILDAGYYNGQFFEILAYAAGGDLLQVAPIREPKLLEQIVAQAGATLDFCHRRQIVHRDIKPDNLFFSNVERERILLGDFGISSMLSEDELNQLTSQSRTPIYAAPEVYQSIAGQTVIQPQVDYYSLGMTLLYLWTGKNPFKGLNEFQIMQTKTQGQLKLPGDMPERLRQLIRGLLTVRTDQRWSWAEIQRWLAGETVPVYDAPNPGHPPFKFGKQASGDSLSAASPAELGQLLRRDPVKGAQFLHSGAIQHWLEAIGEHEMAAGIAELAAQTAGPELAVYWLDPQAALPFRGQFVHQPSELAALIYGPEADWDALVGDENWPEAYQHGLDLLASGELQAWLRAGGHTRLLNDWQALAQQGISLNSRQGLEHLLRLLDPQLPPVRLSLDESRIKQRYRLRLGEIREVELGFATAGPGVPWAEVTLYRNDKKRQFRRINTRQGKLNFRLGGADDQSYHSYQLRLEYQPDAATQLTQSHKSLSYRVGYPWASTGRSLLIAGGCGAAVGLGLRAAISYKYPKPMSSYFGTQVSPAQAQAIKDPSLDYVFYGWALVALILINWLLRSRP
ncbi:MAG: hypothetical protein CVV27_10740 [Candidatus Melainabacteria bacterium HGW-Melainabacteria-1]|nr:MAG: hypothetical protein CVV27_10740 [Candidatus Melainabacteria bacterium HGW-Melainabacteria-1]